MIAFYINHRLLPAGYIVFYIFMPVELMLSTNCLCANRYRIMSGKMIISVPVARMQFEYAIEIVVLTPVRRWIYAPSESTILDSDRLTSVVFPRNILE